MSVVTSESEMDVIRQKLVTVWGSTSAISWDGLNGKEFDRNAGVAFIRPRIEDGDPETVSIGGNNARFRRRSSLVIEVFRPAGSGQEIGLQWCDTLIAGFHRYTSGGVHFDRRPGKRDAGQDGKFYKWFVICPYYVEEVT